MGQNSPAYEPQTEACEAAADQKRRNVIKDLNRFRNQHGNTKLRRIMRDSAGTAHARYGKSRFFLQKRHDEEAELRRSQVGTGDRSEKIRTYNFPQGRVTDHRIKLTLYKIDAIMDGDIQELIDHLTAADQAAKLAKMNQ